MATIRLTPSTYALSSSSYLSVSNASNMYANTDSNTYATVTNSRASTTSYYIYLRGFNFDDIPASAVVTGFVVKLKARESGVSTSTSYKPYLANGTSAINGSCDVITTTAAVHDFSGLSADWETIKEYGSNFGIRINCRRASRNTTGYMYIYGAEIEVTYSVPTPHTITSSTGIGTIDPDGETTVYEGDSYTLNIYGTPVAPTVYDNGVDVSAQVVQHTIGNSGTLTSVIQDYSTSGSINGTYYQSAVGNGSDTSNTSGNDYANNSSAYIYYTFDTSGLPSNATVTGISCDVKGHCESTSNSSEVAEICLYNGSTAISSQVSFTSTSDSVHTLTATSIPSNLSNLQLRFEIGYYGGRVSGATLNVTYTVPSSGSDYYYTYTLNNIQTDHEILVSVGTLVTHTVTSSSTVNNVEIEPSGETVVVEGSSYTIEIHPSSSDKFVVTDNGTDVTSQLTLHEALSEPSYTVDQVSGASYGFTLTSGYYTSQNTGISNSAALASINLDLPVECTVNFYVINYAEATYDYGILGNVDSILSTSYQTDSDYYWAGNTSDKNTTSEQTVAYTVAQGQHHIYAKYKKDQYTDSGSDNFRFRVEIVPNEEIVSNDYYTYTIDDIQGDHTIIISAGGAKIYLKVSGAWVQYSKVYKKINGAWVEQASPETIFSTTVNYVRG